MQSRTGSQPPQVAELLKKELIRRCEKSSRYSLRSFARALDLDPSLLSKIIRGKKNPGPEFSRRIYERMGVPIPQRAEPTAPSSYSEMSENVFRLISDWYHYAILELLSTVPTGSKITRKWIAAELGISEVEADQAIERLIQLELLTLSREGQWKPTGKKLSTAGIPHTSQAQLKNQRQLIEKSLSALEDVPFELRDHSALTLAMDPELLPWARERIKEFRRDLDLQIAKRSKNKKSVYVLSVGLFPVTKSRPQSISKKGKQKS